MQLPLVGYFLTIRDTEMATGSALHERDAKQAALIEAYARTGTIEAAAAQCEIGYRTAKRWLTPAGPLIARARDLRNAWLAGQSDAHGRQAKALVDAADTAIEVLLAQAQTAKSAMARVQAAVAILDRAGHKPIERVEQSVTWEEIGRELVGVDTAAVLREALESIADSPAAQAIDSAK